MSQNDRKAVRGGLMIIALSLILFAAPQGELKLTPRLLLPLLAGCAIALYPVWRRAVSPAEPSDPSRGAHLK